MNQGKTPIIVWFRQDLRLADNPALLAARQEDRPVLPLYILDDKNSGEWKMGGASRWWLHNSLVCLNSALDGMLCLKKGDPLKVLYELIEAQNACGVYWNRGYEPWRIERDKKIKEELGDKEGLDVKSFNGSLLFEPHTVLKDDRTPYKVFTPFYKNGCLGKGTEPRSPEDAPSGLGLYLHNSAGLDLDELELMPSIKWYGQMEKCWRPGEEGAKQRLAEFLDDRLKGYKEGRHYPARKNVSCLSPHLHFGEISPHSVWHQARQRMVAEGLEPDGENFCSELGWREFSYSLLYHFPQLPEKNWQKKFDGFPWRVDKKALHSWQKGKTGYPIVDAGMRELWQTGYMHNRVRMIAGSFLVKNLMLHWHHGEKWFWDTLVDADLANNSASWQWIAGCGADAAPYFRIFNPVTQGQKFDPDGAYVRHYVPEITDLPDKYLHNPWEAPDDVLAAAGVRLGQNYPEPIVNLKETRARALEAFRGLG